MFRIPEQVSNQLEIRVWLKPRKKTEFKQSIDLLSWTLKKICTDLVIEETAIDDIITITIWWSGDQQMRKTLKTPQFAILQGAINALSEKSEIRYNGLEFSRQLDEMILE